MPNISLLQGDCLQVLKTLEDKSVDLILTDPPYNIGKTKWDKVPNYIEWCGKWFIECQRVLKDNGSFYWWQKDMVQIAQLMEWLRNNSEFVFNSFIIWDKGDFRARGWKNPSENNTLRSWFNTCEYCLSYTFQDETGLGKVLKNPAFYGLQNYFLEERKKTGKTATFLDKVMGIKTSYCYWEKPTTHAYRIPDKKNYEALQKYFKGQAFSQEYESLRQEYESLRQEYESLRYTHNLDTNHNNVWKSSEHNSGKQHPTQKPIDLMERIVKTSSKEGGIILDPFMGSGTTGVACKNLNRNFIGIEMEPEYIKIAEARINAVPTKLL